jgi:phosphopantothenoylcysteine decarboxylase/phosphopantothenate--cysteine ligase
MKSLRSKKIVVGITGSIAAYKAAELVSRLRRLGADVHCIMTEKASSFITPLTLETLSQNPVLTKLSSNMEHLRRCDLIVIAPATANIIAKCASGISDDLVSTVLASRTSPVLIAPAMNEAMFSSPILQENIDKLRAKGFLFVGPEKGRLACEKEGVGRLADVDKIVEGVCVLVEKRNGLSNRKILITAGATREPIDPVRYITNRSSGRMGHCLAYQSALYGAKVSLVTTAEQILHPDINTFFVETTEEMKRITDELFDACDILIMTAAVSDFVPKRVDRKIKRRENLELQFVKNPDILADLSKKKGERFLVGFSVDTEDRIESAKSKLISKGLDIIVMSEISDFGRESITPTILYKDGKIERFGEISKMAFAHILLDRVINLCAH